MRPRLAWIIYRKELLDSLRDRRTLVMMLGIPVLLYPMLMMGMAKLQESQSEAREARRSVVAVWGRMPDTLEARLRGNAKLELKVDLDYPAALRSEVAAGRVLPPEVKPGKNPAETSVTRAARQVTLDRRADAVLLVWPDMDAARRDNGQGTVSVLFDSVRPDSGKARERLTDEIQEWRRSELSERERTMRLPPGFTRAVEILSENVAAPQRKSGMLLGTMLCAMLLLMSAMGGFYTAIDQTAGEKERGTMQTLLCAPLRSTEIIAGKFLAVCTVSLAASAANLISMSLTAGRIANGIPGVELKMTWSVFALALVAMIPIAFTLSGLYLAVAAFARDFKEGQNLLAPVMTLIILPVFALMNPSVELSRTTAFIPVVNLGLLVKALFLGEAKADLVFLALLSSAAYATLAILLAARVFERETVMLGGREQIRGLLDFSASRGGVPSAAWSLTMFCIVLVANFYGQLALVNHGVLVLLAVVFVAFFLAPPVAATALMRFSWRDTFQLRPLSGRGVAASVVLGLSAWTVAAGVFFRILPPPESLRKALEEVLMIRDASVPLGLLLFLAAVQPAICEEALFRGFIQTGLRGAGKWAAIGVTALLFALAHGSLHRMPPTLFLGLVIGYAVWQTRSILAGVIIHGLNNGLALWLAREGGSAAGDAVLPWRWTLAGVVLVACGLGMLWRIDSTGSTHNRESAG